MNGCLPNYCLRKEKSCGNPELKPFHIICTPMASKMNAESRVMMVVPDFPNTFTSRSAFP